MSYEPEGARGRGGEWASGRVFTRLPAYPPTRLLTYPLPRSLWLMAHRCFSGSSLLMNRRFVGNPIGLLILITVGGAALRFWHLGVWSFWIDEVLTVLDAQQFSLQNLRINPVPYLLVKTSIALTGKSEWGARFIPCFFGVMTIPLIFWFGRTLFNTAVGLFAASFLACSSWHLFWSQNARGYVFTAFFATLSAWLFFLGIQRQQLRFILGALGATVLLILSHTLSGVIILAFAGYALWVWRQEGLARPSILLAYFLPFVAPVLLLAFPQFRAYLFSGWGVNIWQRSPAYVVMTLVHGLSVPIFVVACLSALSTRMKRETVFLCCYALIPLLFFLIASQFLNVAGYYLFFTTPVYWVLAAVGCARVRESNGLPVFLRWALPSVLIAGSLAQSYLYFRVENGGRPKWREAFSVIRSEMRPDDLIVVTVPRVSEYYLPELQPVFVKPVVEHPEKFERTWLETHARVWFVVDAGSFDVFDAQGEFRRWVRQRARLVESLPVFARAMNRTIDVYLVDWGEE